ncbi:MAG: heme exporter protein CcmB [Bacteroidia bacterium]
MLKSVWYLIRKDLLLEWREKNAISAIILYVLSTAFVIYQMFLTTASEVWVSLYWIVTLFAAVNASARSFINESGNTKLYYFQLVSPQAMILSKMLFNALLMILLAFFSSLIFGVLLGFPIQSTGLWFLISVVGAIGLAFTFTMISAIASKARNAGVLMTILGLPVIIPQMLVLVKLSKAALLVTPVNYVAKPLTGLLSIDLVVFVVAVLFFPFLWKD